MNINKGDNEMNGRCINCNKELTISEIFYYDGRCEDCYKRNEENIQHKEAIEIIDKIRQLSEDWRQEASYCEMKNEEDKKRHYDIRAEVWDLASEYLLNFAADLENDFLN